MGESNLERSYYEQKLEEGLRFQDHITDKLYQLGIVLVTYVSKARSLKAENKAGIEIKRDGLFRSSGNLYIETAEKSHASNLEYVASGIYRDDGSWLYLIGDEETFWIFPKTLLQRVEQTQKYTSVMTATSRGFLLPVDVADRLCARKVSEDENPPRRYCRKCDSWGLEVVCSNCGFDSVREVYT